MGGICLLQSGSFRSQLAILSSSTHFTCPSVSPSAPTALSFCLPPGLFLLLLTADGVDVATQFDTQVKIHQIFGIKNWATAANRTLSPRLLESQIVEMHFPKVLLPNQETSKQWIDPNPTYATHSHDRSPSDWLTI